MITLTEQILTLVKAALEEDIGPGDLTSLGCLEPNPVTGRIVAKSDGVISGIKPLLAAFEVVDSANTVTVLKNDGDSFLVGDVIADIEGFNQTVMATERVALNFLGRLSGIASLTRQFVERTNGTACRILDTRKTTPGWRLLEKEAVRHGGGLNHRLGLYEMILIKDNHIASAGSITEAVRLARDFLTTPDFRQQFKRPADEIEIEVEISTAEQLVEAVDCGITRLLLDNQSLDSLRIMVAQARQLKDGLLLEASGNVNLDTAAAVAAIGVDFISIGALTHSAPAADFSMQVRSA